MKAEIIAVADIKAHIKASSLDSTKQSYNLRLLIEKFDFLYSLKKINIQLIF